MTDHIETTLPALVFTVASVPGDAAATARLVIDNDASAGSDWWGVAWGTETSAQYDITAASAALFYEAESRTALSGSATAAGPSGASGGGSNVMRNTALATSYQAIMSTQATGGGAQLSHVGLFRFLARVQIPTSNTGVTSVMLEWGAGDFLAFTPNTARVLDSSKEGKWCLLDLGLVSIPKNPLGAQTWQGRILAKSTVAGDDIDIDCFALIPAQRYGMATAVLRNPTPNAWTLLDEFDQSSGALNAKTLNVGGTWATSGSATDLTVSGSGTVTRATSSDGSPRWAIAGTATPSTVEATLDLAASSSDSDLDQALVIRYVDANNYLRFVASSPSLTVEKVIAGTPTTLATGSFAAIAQPSAWTLRVRADALGRWWAWVSMQGVATTAASLQGQDSSLATGGTLASGKVAFYDFNTDASPIGRTYYRFTAWVPPTDAGVFAGQSLQVRSDSVLREDSAGATWQTPSSYRGSYLSVPPAGAESRLSRFIVRPLLHPEVDGVWLDDRIDDLSAKLMVTARYL